MKILIAEDDAVSRALLEKRLMKWGHQVSAVENGREALDIVIGGEGQFELAILDWMMPEMDGVTVCHRLRNTRQLPYIYIIMLTAKSQLEDIQTGYDAGADDYMAKPLDFFVLKSRIQVAERIMQYEQQLRRQNAELESIAAQRAKQLIHAERMASVGLLSAGIAHEINNPTAFISGNVQTLERFWNDIEPILLKHTGDQDKVSFILEETPKITDGIRSGVKRISAIVNGLKAFCRKTDETRTVCDIHECIDQALLLCHNTLKHRVTVEKKLDAELSTIYANNQEVEQVFINLLTNAADAIGDNQGAIMIQTRVENKTVCITVQDTGPGIPEDRLLDIWQPFYTTKPVGKGTGLGLSIVAGIVENHQGTIVAKNNPVGGAVFHLTFPEYTGDNQ